MLAELTLVVASCTLPLNVSVIAPDLDWACQQVERAYASALNKAWFAEYIQPWKPPVFPWDSYQLEDFGLLEIVEHSGPMFPCSQSLTGFCAGRFNTEVWPPRLEYAREHVGVLVHEFGHAFYWRHWERYGPGVHTCVGHNIPCDPYWELGEMIQNFLDCPYPGVRSCQTQ